MGAVGSFFAWAATAVYDAVIAPIGRAVQYVGKKIEQGFNWCGKQVDRLGEWIGETGGAAYMLYPFYGIGKAISHVGSFAGDVIQGVGRVVEKPRYVLQVARTGLQYLSNITGPYVGAVFKAAGELFGTIDEFLDDPIDSFVMGANAVCNTFTGRSVTVTLCNDADMILSRVDYRVESGSWMSEPPSTIDAHSSVSWSSGSKAFAGTSGFVTFEFYHHRDNEQKQLQIYWNNPYAGKNEHKTKSPKGYELSHGDASGYQSSVFYTFRPSQWHIVKNSAGREFLPKTFGLHFENNFSENLPAMMMAGISIPSPGLCGGMVFVARDFFEHNINSPKVSQIPSDEDDPLYKYIRRRQIDSFVPQIGNRGLFQLVLEYMNPDTDISEVASKEWRLVKQDIDSGHPPLLCIIQERNRFAAGGERNHQILAYGYKIDGGEVELMIYDPNYPDDDTVRLKFAAEGGQDVVSYTREVDGQRVDEGEKGAQIYTFFRIDDYRLVHPEAYLGGNRTASFSQEDETKRNETKPDETLETKPDETLDWEPFHKASENLVIHMLTEGRIKDADRLDKSGWNMLHWAVFDRRKRVVEKLLELQLVNVNVNTRDFHCSHCRGKGKSQCECRRDVDTDYRLNQARSALHLAVTVGDEEIVCILLSHGAESRIYDWYGSGYPLWLAIVLGHLSIVDKLLRACDPAKLSDDRTRFMYFFYPFMNNETKKSLFYILKAGGIDMNRKTCFRDDQDWYGYDSFQHNLMWATLDEDEFMIDLMLSDGASVHGAPQILWEGFGRERKANKRECTLLHYAAAVGSRRLVDKYMGLGVDPLAIDKFNETPAMTAASFGHKKLAYYLQECAKNRGYVDGSLDNGWTALHRACAFGLFNEASAMIEQGALNEVGVTGRKCTLLHLAVTNNNIDIVRYLLPLCGREFVQIGANLYCGLDSPGALAARKGNIEIAKVLLDFSHMDLFEASRYSAGCLRPLLGYKSDDNVTPYLLSIAIKHGNAESVTVLLDRGFDIDEFIGNNSVVHSWVTPLMLAVICGKEAVVQLLLDRNANWRLLTEYSQQLCQLPPGSKAVFEIVSNLSN